LFFLSFGAPFRKTPQKGDPVIGPFNEATCCEAAENQYQSRLSAPDNQPKKQQHPDKMCERFFALYVLIQDMGISNSADHQHRQAESEERQGIHNSVFADKVDVCVFV